MYHHRDGKRPSHYHTSPRHYKFHKSMERIHIGVGVVTTYLKTEFIR
jgi:hypothetical protein